MRALLWLSLAALLMSRQPAIQSIEIWSEHPIAVDIEWVTIDAAGTQTVTARRQRAIGPPVPLEFTHGADRYVRFSYQGASPRTYSTAELIAAGKLHVPNVLPGGELLLIVPRMTIRPAQLLIEGPRMRTILLEDAIHASLSGMTSGDYRVVPVYEGGLKGAVREVAVRTAETTLVHLAPEAVGAVRVVAAPDVCATATDLRLNVLVQPNVGAAFRTPPNRVRVATTRNPRCEMTLAGLGPGNFEAVYYRDGSRVASGTFDVAAQRISTVAVAGAGVRVEGRVTLNGNPIADATVTFAPRFTPGERVPAPAPAEGRTDAGGYYSVPLEVPGPYSVGMRRARLAMTGRAQATFVEGYNMHDISLTGGTITLEVKGWDDPTPLQVRIQGTNSTMTSMFGASSVLRPFEALPFGVYRVSVATGGTPMSRRTGTSRADTKTVTLSPSSPEATVTFDLTGR